MNILRFYIYITNYVRVFSFYILIVYLAIIVSHLRFNIFFAWLMFLLIHEYFILICRLGQRLTDKVMLMFT